MALVPLIELYNQAGSTELLPNEGWRGQIGLQANSLSPSGPRRAPNFAVLALLAREGARFKRHGDAHHGRKPKALLLDALEELGFRIDASDDLSVIVGPLGHFEKRLVQRIGYANAGTLPDLDAPRLPALLEFTKTVNGVGGESRGTNRDHDERDVPWVET